jgi:hypothetical protein
MARNFNELRSKMSPGQRARAEARAAELMKAVPLAQIRKARELTQIALAE